MKYYLIVGEASGDLHASRLMAELKRMDPHAEFRFFGGDLMSGVGGTRVKHYRELAYMGFVPVLLHLPTILSNMKRCKRDVLEWHPDVLILVDYPGFNLSIAKYIKAHSAIPVYYYISPKIWAWKEYRIKNIKRDVDELFSILPFEVDFYRKHNYPIHYVGNPTVDEVAAFRAVYQESASEFFQRNNLDHRPVLALLAGSRRQEIKDNLPLMVKAARYFPDYQCVVAGAPGLTEERYAVYLEGEPVRILFGETFPLLSHAALALVTSGTATLEAALFNVPQVVCYYIPCGKLISFLRKLFLKVHFISLVNLIADKEVVRELVAGEATVENLQKELQAILCDASYREKMRQGYDRMAQILGAPGAPRHAAAEIVKLLS